jgi:MFS family permease
MPRIGWLLALNGVFIVLGQPIALRWLRRFGPVHWISAGAVMTGLGLGTLAFAGGGASLYALSTFLWTAGEIGFSTAVPVIVAEFAPAAERGAYQGTYQLAWGTASTLAPALGSLVLARLGAPALWSGCVVLCLAAAALHRQVTAASLASLSSRALASSPSPVAFSPSPSLPSAGGQTPP